LGGGGTQEEAETVGTIRVAVHTNHKWIKPFKLHFFTWSFIVWKTCLNYEYKWNTAQLMLNHNQSTNIIWNIDIWHVISSKSKLESQRSNENKFRTGLPGALGHSGHYPDFQVANVTTFRVCIVDWLIFIIKTSFSDNKWPCEKM
jgi:hypothetical protein